MTFTGKNDIYLKQVTNSGVTTGLDEDTAASSIPSSDYHGGMQAGFVSNTVCDSTCVTWGQNSAKSNYASVSTQGASGVVCPPYGPGTNTYEGESTHSYRDYNGYNQAIAWPLTIYATVQC